MSFQLTPILARNALSSTYGKNIAINPYQGCVFACEFCSAIKMNFFTGRTTEKWDKTGWGEWIDYKTNLVELLYKERDKVKKSKIYFGNATDIYMPIERKLKLVPPILEFFFWTIRRSNWKFRRAELRAMSPEIFRFCRNWRRKRAFSSVIRFTPTATT